MGTLNSRGMSILSVLFLIAVTSAILSGFISMILNQNKESQSIAELMTMEDFERSLTAALSDKKVCSFIMGGHIFNSAHATAAVPYVRDIGATPVYASMISTGIPGVLLTQKGQRIHPSNDKITVESIRYELFPGRIVGTTGLFYGQWVISLDSTKAIRRYKPVILESSALIDMTDPDNAIITNCFGYNENAVITQSCPDGMAVNGYTSAGTIKCKNNHPPRCPAGQLYSGMNNDGSVRCINQVQVGSCPSGQVMIGIDDDLTPQCRNL